MKYFNSDHELLIAELDGGVVFDRDEVVDFDWDDGEEFTQRYDVFVSDKVLDESVTVDEDLCFVDFVEKRDKVPAEGHGVGDELFDFGEVGDRNEFDLH